MRNKLYYCFFSLFLFGCERRESTSSYQIYVNGYITPEITEYVTSIKNEKLALSVRSAGGKALDVVTLGLFLSKNDTIIKVHDFCYSTCAELILPAAQDVEFINKPIVGFNWNPIMDFNQYTKLNIAIPECELFNFDKHLMLLLNNGMKTNFWKEVEKRLVSKKFIPVDVGTNCPLKVREFEHDLWLPTSKQLRSLWGLKFEGKLCADDADTCKPKIDILWQRGKSIIIGDELYISKGR